jgi:hypothetical protein
MHTMISSQTERFEVRGSSGQGPLADLARGTDGAFIPAGANPRKIAQGLVHDLSSYYQVSYVPPFKEYDG